MDVSELGESQPVAQVRSGHPFIIIKFFKSGRQKAIWSVWPDWEDDKNLGGSLGLNPSQ